jgi:hypothetical protein
MLFLTVMPLETLCFTANNSILKQDFKYTTYEYITKKFVPAFLYILN